MAKRDSAFTGALSLLLLASCGGREAEPTDNAAAAAGPNSAAAASPSETPPADPANAGAGAVPPPDAVSHPDGYLPPAPDSNSSGPDPSGPATEDEYLRNGQAGR
ncbi:MAG TPA: hypothetical protein VEW26_15605 [Allosphingosinicella sp.]|nr:hypothetical protein [Allosphingosinicella sp.]